MNFAKFKKVAVYGEKVSADKCKVEYKKITIDR
jgi:hypothetical protein